MTADFSGYATRYNLRCSDGRTILADAFNDQDGQEVPLVWAHGADNIKNILGHVKLEHVDDGVLAHAYFNGSDEAQHAKEMVRHGDVKFLSIFANRLVEKAKNVIKGKINEVSLVIGGANPGATIDNLSVVHSDGEVEFFNDEAIITTGLEIKHAATATAKSKEAETEEDESEDKSLAEILETLNEEQATAVDYLLSQALTVGDQIKHSESGSEENVNTEDNSEESVEAEDNSEESDEAESNSNEESSEGADANSEENVEVDADSEESADENADADSNSEENAEANANTDENADAEAEANNNDAEASAEVESNTGAGDDNAVQHDNTNQEENSMTHNVFDQTATGPTVAHTQVKPTPEQVKGILAHADEVGSLKKAMKSYMDETGVKVGGELKHGIENIDYLFPDAKLLDASPQFLSRRMEWVDKVLGSVRKTPFGRIKSVTADITMEDARARGYIKGNMKKEEFFELSKRETTPQTIYKKQALDRDDVIDIVDLDVVAWMKAEMKVMLDEEIAAAILFGDGRSNGDDDKIKTDKVRPIASDAELYVTTINTNLDDASSSIEEFVDLVIENRHYYKGTGTPSFYTTEATLSKFLKVKDNFGRRIYASLDDVRTILRVSEIVVVEAMERVPDLLGIMVNLTDYTIGTDRGGQATMFDDFDIDFNKLKYLIETRLSGALTKPKSALVFRSVPAASVLRVPTAPTFDGNTVTVPTVTGVVYKDAAGNTLTTGSPVELDEGEELHVIATPGANSYFENDAEDEWHYTGEPA